MQALRSPRARPACVAAIVVLVSVATCAVAVPLRAQSPDRFFRVFLRDGTALAVYGDIAIVGGRAIFTLAVGEGPSTKLQLMSLALAAIDLEKTESYSRSLRAEHYAATRGESEYSAMTAEVAAALEYLTQVSDPKERLAMAERAKARVLSWSREHYDYRADDIAVLAGLFDEVIAELRAAAGQSSFTLDLTTAPTTPLDPLLPAPDLRESISLALTAAKTADVPDERLAVLRTAIEALDGRDGESGLRADVERELDVELAIGEAYRLLGDELLSRASTAAARGDVKEFAGLRVDLATRDASLGKRRPADVARLEQALDGFFDRAVARRLQLDSYVSARSRIFAYEREVRPALSGVDGLRPVLEFLRDQKPFSYERLELSLRRFSAFIALVTGMMPPSEVADAHATLTSALHMAQQASARRKLAVVTRNAAFDREAAVAASGALLLVDQARQMLLERMRSGPRR